MASSLLARFENNRVFSESEGWALFRLAAIGEACGWTMLIIGIVLSKYIFPSNQYFVQLAGRFHGMLFLFYALAAIGLYPAMRWSRRRAFIALLASVPPYGSLIFEQWASYQKKYGYFNVHFRCTVLHVLTGQSANFFG